MRHLDIIPIVFPLCPSGEYLSMTDAMMLNKPGGYRHRKNYERGVSVVSSTKLCYNNYD